MKFRRILAACAALACRASPMPIPDFMRMARLPVSAILWAASTISLPPSLSASGPARSAAGTAGLCLRHRHDDRRSDRHLGRPAADGGNGDCPHRSGARPARRLRSQGSGAGGGDRGVCALFHGSCPWFRNACHVACRGLCHGLPGRMLHAGGIALASLRFLQGPGRASGRVAGAAVALTGAALLAA